MRILASLIASFAAHDVGAALRRARRSALIYALAALLMLTAYAAVVAGVAILAAQAWGGVAAAFVIAAAAFALAVLLIAGVMLVNQIERRRERRSHAGRALASTAAVALLPLLVRSRLLLTLPLIAGLLLAFTSMQSRDEG